MTILRRIAPLGLALAAALSTSCLGGGATGTVKGKITVNNQPLPSGLITFESQVGNMDAFSAAIRDGVYETAAIPVGPCKVTVIHSSVGPGGGGGNDLVPGRKANPTDVPVKYHKSDTSGLTFEVKRGENTFDKDLTP